MARSQGRPGVGVGCTRGVQAKQGERFYLRGAGQGVMSSPVDSCRSALLLMRREREGVRGVRKKRDVTVALKGERTLVTLGGRGGDSGDRAKWRELEQGLLGSDRDYETWVTAMREVSLSVMRQCGGDRAWGAGV